jgi:hypothetical protein
MSDRELLELAARAADISLLFPGEEIGGRDPRNAKTHDVWNPLKDNGDALWLAAQLALDIEFKTRGHITDGVVVDGSLTWIDANEGICAVLRRAIVRAAAEIGKGMSAEG